VLCEAALVGQLGHRRRKGGRYGADARERRIEAADIEIGRRDLVRQGLGRDEEHLIGDMVRLRGDHAEPEAGEDIGVVALARDWVRPFRRTGANGLPLANSARPFDHAYASSAVHSDLDVGLDSAKMMGCSLKRAIASTTGRVKACAVPEMPMIALGLSRSTATSKSGARSASWAKGLLCGTRSVRPRTIRPFESTNQQRRRASASGILSAINAVTIRSPIRGRPRPHRERERIDRRGGPRHPQGRIDAGQRHRGRALDVVVEATHPVAIAVQQAEGVGVPEVLELDHGLREYLLRRQDEFVQKLIVGRSAQPARAD
jgi:hypothetical protein